MRNYPSRVVTYEGCLEFIEVKKQIRLFDFQKEIIKCFFEGKRNQNCPWHWSQYVCQVSWRVCDLCV